MKILSTRPLPNFPGLWIVQVEAVPPAIRALGRFRANTLDAGQTFAPLNVIASTADAHLIVTGDEPPPVGAVILPVVPRGQVPASWDHLTQEQRDELARATGLEQLDDVAQSRPTDNPDPYFADARAVHQKYDAHGVALLVVDGKPAGTGVSFSIDASDPEDGARALEAFAKWMRKIADECDTRVAEVRRGRRTIPFKLDIDATKKGGRRG